MSRDHSMFVTDGVRAELRRKSVRSSAVTVGARGAQMVLFLGSAMVLARLLTPSDFGVQAMVLPVAFLANNVANLGLQSAVIHRESLDAADASDFFWLTMRLSGAVAVGMAVLVPILSRFYHEPRVLGVGLVWAATIFAAALSAVQEALLKRQMRFDLVMAAQLTAVVVSVAASVAAAWAGWGYWALMVQVSVMELTRVVCIWLVCPWRPSARRRTAQGEAEVAMRRYWSHLSISRAVSWIGDQLDRIMVGAVGGASVAGLYDSAKRWAGFAFQELFMSLSDVAVGSLSRVAGEATRYRVFLRNTFLPILSLSMPVMAFMFIEARRVLHVLLGNQWLSADGFVRMMCIASVAATAGKLMQWVYMSLGQTDRQLRWTFVTTPVNVAAVLLGATFGSYGVAVAVAVANVALAVPAVWYATRRAPVALRECACVFFRPLTAAVGAALAVRSVDGTLPMFELDVFSVSLRLAAFLVVYVALWLAIPGGPGSFRDILHGLADLRRRRTSEGAGATAVPSTT